MNAIMTDLDFSQFEDNPGVSRGISSTSAKAWA